MNITASYLNMLRTHLSDRDLQIIATVAHFKLISGNQVQRLFFPLDETEPADALVNKTRVRVRQDVLKRLKEHRILNRLDKRVSGGSTRGSSSFLYRLDVAGQHIAETTSSRPRRPLQWYDPLVAHTLAITELYVQLTECHRTEKLTLIDYKTEPYCWRTYPQGVLKPDAFVQVGLSANGQRRKGSFFIEVDRASQRGTKIDTKFPQYIDYWEYHRAANPGQVFPQVLFLAPHAGRVDYLNGLIRSRPNMRALFRAELMDDAMVVLSGTR
jgi:hypothetical protein